MDKILTIVIPTYNMEKYLRKCLDSLIIDNQKLFNMLEVLVVNDGSKDSSSSIAHEYQDKYPNVFRVIDKENGNYGSCVNRGLKEATGKYFKILDADDSYDSKGLESFIEVLQRTNVDLCVTDYVAVDGKGNIVRTVRIPDGYNEKIILAKEFDWKTLAAPLLLSMHAFCIKTELLRKNGYKQQEGISYTDTEFNYFCLLYAQTIGFYGIEVYHYLVGRDGQTIDPNVMARSSLNFYKVGSRLLGDCYKRIGEINDVTKNNILEPALKATASFFYAELFIKPSSQCDKEHINILMQQCIECGINIKRFRYRSLKYLWWYKKFGCNYNWLYNLKRILK